MSSSRRGVAQSPSCVSSVFRLLFFVFCRLLSTRQRLTAANVPPSEPPILYYTILYYAILNVRPSEPPLKVFADQDRQTAVTILCCHSSPDGPTSPLLQHGAAYRVSYSEIPPRCHIVIYCTILYSEEEYHIVRPLRGPSG